MAHIVNNNPILRNAPLNGNRAKQPGSNGARMRGPGGQRAIGTKGFDYMGGVLNRAYTTELQWPQVYTDFHRLRTSNPSMIMAGTAFKGMVPSMSLQWELPPHPTDDDKKLNEFAEESLTDLAGGAGRILESMVTYVPFMGWGAWEVLPGLRREGWHPPGELWHSSFNDGLATVRELAFRDHSSLIRWEVNEATGKVLGMVQLDHPNNETTIKSSRLAHITFGDIESPEGNSPMVAVWRLDAIKRGLETIQGIGFEHAAGHSVFNVDGKISDKDKANIRSAAKALGTAQPGNFLVLPQKVTAELMDVNFSAGPAILEAIRYYGILELQAFMMQWVALSSTSGLGSQAGMTGSTDMFLTMFNSMVRGMARQLGNALAKVYFSPSNLRSFPNISRIPELTATKGDRIVPLDQLARLAEVMPLIGMGPQDVIAFRKASGVLPANPPADDDLIQVAVKKAGGGIQTARAGAIDGDDAGEGELAIGENAGLAEFASDPPLNRKAQQDAVAQWQRWAKENAPNLLSVIDPAIDEEVRVEQAPEQNDDFKMAITAILAQQAAAANKGNDDMDVHLHIPTQIVDIPQPNIVVENIVNPTPTEVNVAAPEVTVNAPDVQVTTGPTIVRPTPVTIENNPQIDVNVENQLELPLKVVDEIDIKRTRDGLKGTSTSRIEKGS